MCSRSSMDKYEALLTNRTHEIIEACKEQNYDRFVAELKVCTETGRALNVCDTSGWQAIHYACKLDDTRFLQALLNEDQLLIHSQTYENVTPLIVAAGVGNLNGVKFLLSVLDGDDGVKWKTIHDTNALYYAVKCVREPEASEIACLLIERCSDIDFIGAMDLYDSIPFRVVKQKNLCVLQALLEAGLNPNYSTGEKHFFDADFDDDVRDAKMPFTMIGYCVTAKWVEGMKVIVEAQKKQGSEDSTCGEFQDSAIMSPCHLFKTWCIKKFQHEIYNYYSAWYLVFVVGDVDCLMYMQSEGMLLTEDCYSLNDLVYLPYDDVVDIVDAIRPKLSFEVMFSNDIWSKQNLLSKMCEKNIWSVYADCISEAGDYPSLYPNPLMLAVQSIFDAQNNGHSIVDTVAMLTNYGFDFEYDKISVPMWTPEKDTCRSASLLVMEAAVRPHLSKVIEYLLDKLYISAETLALACQYMFSRQNHFGVTLEDILGFSAPHMLILRTLSRQHSEDIKKELSDITVVGHGLRYRKHRSFRRGKAKCNSLAIIQLIMKGVKPAATKGCKNHITFPVACMFMDYDNRKYVFNKQMCLYPHNLIKYNPNAPLSLKYHCRQVVRESIGVARLIKEPVPRNTSSEPFPVDESWEESTIDKLSCLPLVLRDYLKYRPEFEDFVEYMTLHSRSQADEDETDD